jgi:hypothetical protein
VVPFNDSVPLTEPSEVPPGVVVEDLPDAVVFHCGSAVGGSDDPEASAGTAQALELQDLTREPCQDAQTQRRILGTVNVVLAIAALVGLFLVGRRRATAT